MAVSEMVVRLLRLCVPAEAVVAARRKEAKELHWVQSVRRGLKANIGDFVCPKEDRAPIVPPELRIPEKFHVPFAVSYFD